MPKYRVLRDCYESNTGTFLAAGDEIEITSGDRDHPLKALMGHMERIDEDPEPVEVPSAYDWANKHSRDALLAACKALDIEGITARSAKGDMAAALAERFSSPEDLPEPVAARLVLSDE